MTNVVFFNYYHNGDIHVSRSFVRLIMEKVKLIQPDTIFSYSHRNGPQILADIPNLNYNPALLAQVGNEHANLHKTNDAVYINTWYAQQHFRYMNRFGISIDSLYAAFDDTCKALWGFEMSDITAEISKFFPLIDYSKFEIDAAKTWLYEHPEKKIFVETGMAHSGQATNFVMTPTIISLANKHPDKIFILSNQEGHYPLPINVVYSADIIKKQIMPDLNENSFLSTHCDVIIGKASGPFTFAMTQENLFERKAKFICFTNLAAPDNKFWVGDLLRDKVNYSAEFIVRNEANPDSVFQIIDSNL